MSLLSFIHFIRLFLFCYKEEFNVIIIIFIFIIIIVLGFVVAVVASLNTYAIWMFRHYSDVFDLNITSTEYRL